MNTIVLYRSKHGHTKRYAAWIAAALGCDAKELKSVSKKELKRYDTVLFGTGIYMGNMKKLGKFKRMIGDQKAIIFAVGGSLETDEYGAEVRDRHFSHDELNQFTFFYLPGGIDLTKVKGVLKFFLNIGRKGLENKKDKTKDDIEFLRGFHNPTDHVDKKHIAELVDYVRNL